MPFDGASATPEVAALQRLLAFYSGEDTWLGGEWFDRRGRKCVVKAYQDICRDLGMTDAKAIFGYLRRAVLQNHRLEGPIRSLLLIGFNDFVCSGIEEMRDTIRLAIVLATNYTTDTLPHAPDSPGGYQPWESWSAAARGFAGLERSAGIEASQLDLPLALVAAGR